MDQHTPSPGKSAPQRMARPEEQGKGWRLHWRELPLLAFLIYGFLYLPTQGSALHRVRLGYIFVILGVLLLGFNLAMAAKRRSVVPVLLSFVGTAAALALVDDWAARAGLVLGAVALDAGVLLWARSRHS